MLHRAASNAYSWWWASHVRTKQSKWLEQSLHDMEDKVQCMLKIIEDDGDSFAKRAEMYYRRRPELINFVEESFRAYRALAERYEHIAGELQTANQTIATVFPEHAQIAMEDEDEDTSSSEKSTKPVKPPPKGLPEAPPNMPKFSIISSSPTNQQVKKAIPSIKRVYSHKSNSEALEKIDKLQKGILVLQTEKEFIKGSYENGLAKYWDIENCITEMQKEVSSLQEEFGQGLVIEDDEARSLMAATALKSCKDALMQLLEKQERSNAEATVENQRVKDICKRLEALKDQTNQQRPEMENSQPNASSLTKPQQVDISKQKALDLDSTCDKIRKNFASFDVAVLAEKIDELVTKVNNLETAVSSQSALIERLRSETNQFHTKVETLEEDKETLSEGSNHLSNKLQLLDKELKGIQELNKTVEDQGNALQINFTEAHSEFKYISEELHSFKQPDASTNPFLQDEPGLPLISESHIQSEKEREDASNLAVNLVNGMDRITDKEDVEGHNVQEEDGEQPDISEKQQEPKHRETDEKQDTYPNGDNLVNGGPQEHTKDKEDQPDWQKLFLDGMEDREKILLIEYTSTLRNYKGVKRKIQEMEKKNQDSLAEITLQLKKLESANAMKDEEIRSLHQKLKLSQKSSGKNSCNNSSESGSPQLRSLKDIMAKGSGTQSSKNVTLNTLLEEEDATANSRPDESSGAEKTPTQENEDVVNVTVTDEPHHASTVEEKFRRDIDGLLEENLKFWLKFSTCFHEIQKFQTAVEDLEAEYSKLKGKKKEDDNPDTGTDSMTTDQDGTKNDNTTAVPPLRSDVHPLQEHLREVQKEMKVWLQENRLLKEELRCRLSSLGHIQDEISRVSKDASENEEVKFTSYQAAKFQGEVLNMQQENNKVKQELESGVEHVKAIQVDIEKLLSKLDKDLELPGTKPNEDHEPQTSKSNEELKGSGSKSRQGELRHSATKTQVPLRSFLFGTKPKKHRPSLFTRIHPHSKSKS